jgi:hypothetical protein
VKQLRFSQVSRRFVQKQQSFIKDANRSIRKIDTSIRNLQRAQDAIEESEFSSRMADLLSDKRKQLDQIKTHETILKTFREGSMEELKTHQEGCSVCLSVPLSIRLLMCKHTICRSCFDALEKESKTSKKPMTCPMCRRDVSPKDTLLYVASRAKDEDESAQLERYGSIPFQLLKEVRVAMRTTATTSSGKEVPRKVLVFAKGKRAVDFLDGLFTREKIVARVLPASRGIRRVLTSFQDGSTKILIIDLENTIRGTNAEGINLQCATDVMFVTTPHVNNLPVLQQAWGRAYRVGQKCSINIHLFSSRGTAENVMARRIMEAYHGRGDDVIRARIIAARAQRIRDEDERQEYTRQFTEEAIQTQRDQRAQRRKRARA